MDATRKAVTTPEAAKAQLADGYKALGELLDNYDKVTEEGGGDGIRRVLGTVGTTSPVYLIEPAFRLLFEKDESLPMEYIEGVESVMLGLQLADSEAYSANFVRWRRLEPRACLQHRFLKGARPCVRVCTQITFSSAKGKPEDYFKRAKGQIVKAREKWLELMGLVGVKP